MTKIFCNILISNIVVMHIHYMRLRHFQYVSSLELTKKAVITVGHNNALNPTIYPEMRPLYHNDGIGQVIPFLYHLRGCTFSI